MIKQKPLNRVAFVLYISENITQSILHFLLTERSIQHRIKCGLFFFIQLLHQSHFLHQRFIERVYIIKKFIRFKQVGKRYAKSRRNLNDRRKSRVGFNALNLAVVASYSHETPNPNVDRRLLLPARVS